MEQHPNLRFLARFGTFPWMAGHPQSGWSGLECRLGGSSRNNMWVGASLVDVGQMTWQGGSMAFKTSAWDSPPIQATQKRSIHLILH